MLVAANKKYYFLFPIIAILLAFWLILSPISNAQLQQETVSYPITTTNIIFSENKVIPNADSEEELKVDDGTLDGRGVLADGLVIVNRLTPSNYPVKLKTIRIFFPSFQGQPSPIGRSIRLIAFLDPFGNGSPISNPTLIVSQWVTIASLGSYIDFLVNSTVNITSGDIYVGYQAPNPASGVGFAADTNSLARRRSYFSTNGGATFSGPLAFSDGTDANIMIRAVVIKESSQTGDFSLSATPSSQQVVAGKTANFTLNTQSIAGFNGTINLSSSVTPQQDSVRVSFSPSSVTAGNTSNISVTTNSNTPAGNYQINIIGVSGTQTHQTLVNLTVIQENLPVITVKATTPLAYEKNSVAGVFTITRSEELNKMVVINYQLSGTATINQDYVGIVNQLVIPAGATSATLSIIPIDDTVPEGDETIILSLLDDPTYKLSLNSQDTVTIVDDDNWEKLSSTTVDKKGGTVAAGGLVITIPKKAIKTPSTIEVYRGIGLSTMDNIRTSDVYRVTGLSQDLYKSVKLSLETESNNLEGNPFVVLTTETFVPSLGKVDTVSQTIPATSANNLVSVNLPISPKTSTKTLMMDQGIEPLFRDEIAVEMHAVKLRSKTSSTGKFIATYVGKSGDPMEKVAEEVLKIAEEAYNKLESFGVSMSKRTDPIVLDMETFSSSEEGRVGETTAGFLGKFFGPNHYSIRLNKERIMEGNVISQKLRETIPHELCHIAQSLYDSRSYFAMATSADPWFWLEEAICTWFEWKMTDTSRVPDNVAEDKYQFLFHHGLHFPPATSSTEEITSIQNHGYGASMFLSYVTSKAANEITANNSIGTLIKSRITNPNPIEPIKKFVSTNTADQLTNVWDSFCEDWMSGDIYQNEFPQLMQILGSANNKFVFDDPTKTSMVVEWTSQDISATLYSYQFNPSLNWAANTKLKFTLTGSNVLAYIFNYDADSRSLISLGSFNDKFEIANAETLSKPTVNKQVLVMIVNTNATSPYTNFSPSSLDLTIEQPYQNLYQLQRTALLYNEYLQAEINFRLEGDHSVIKDTYLNLKTQETHFLHLQIPKITTNDSRIYNISVSISNLRPTDKTNLSDATIKKLVFRIVDSDSPNGREQTLTGTNRVDATLRFDKNFTKTGGFSIYGVWNIGSSDLEAINFVLEK